MVGLIAPTMPGLVVDATFGGGGHTRRLLEEFGDRVRVVAIDRDPDALARAADLGIDAVQGNFADLEEMVSSVTDEAPAAVLFDFGVSSHQVDTAERGFSYRHDGPLDMRMGPDAPYTAAEIVNEWPEAELARIIRRYGEEPQAGRIASALVTTRPFETTGQLSTVIAAAVPAPGRTSTRHLSGAPHRRERRDRAVEAVWAGHRWCVGWPDRGHLIPLLGPGREAALRPGSHRLCLPAWSPSMRMRRAPSSGS